jgi:hypothetical protein
MMEAPQHGLDEWIDRAKRRPGRTRSVNRRRRPRTPRGTMVTLADGHRVAYPRVQLLRPAGQPGRGRRAFANVNWTNAEARVAAVALVRLAMDRNYPGIPTELVVQLLDHEAAADAFKVIWVQNGMKVRDLLLRMGLDPPETPTRPATDWGRLYAWLIRHLRLPPSTLDHELDVPLYEALCAEWEDAPPVDITVARYLGIKPKEKPIEDPDEIVAAINAFLRA